MKIKFLDELPKQLCNGLRRSKHDGFRAACRANPSKWAEFKRKPIKKRSSLNGFLFNVKNTMMWRGFEASVVYAEADAILYVRFVGDGGAA